MSTLHIYQSNVGSRIILRSPLVQLSELWRDRSGYKEPILLLTTSRVKQLEFKSTHHLIWPYQTEHSQELLQFIKKRGGEIEDNNTKLHGVTITNGQFILPWIPSENPESVGECSERAGVLEIVEFPAQFAKYIHLNSPIVTAITHWKVNTGYPGAILIWSVVDTDEEEPHRSTRLLWPIEEAKVTSLLAHLDQDPLMQGFLTAVTNPGSYADPWGRVYDVSIVIPGNKRESTSSSSQLTTSTTSSARSSAEVDPTSETIKDKRSDRTLIEQASLSQLSERDIWKRSLSAPALTDSTTEDSSETKVKKQRSPKLRALFHRKKK